MEVKAMKKLLFVLMLLASVFSIYAQNTLVFNSQEFSPFIYTQGGKPAGPGADIIATACKNAGIQYQINFYPWTRSVKEAEDGKVNGLLLLAKNKEREAWLDFSVPLIDTEYGFFVVKTDNTKYSTDFKEFAGKTIGVYGPSNTATSLEAFAKTVEIKTDMTVDDESAFKKLNAGRYEGVYSNKDVGLALVKSLSLNNVKYAGKQKPLVYYISLTKKTNPELRKKFLDEVTKMKADGTLNKILSKYSIHMAK